MTIGKIIVRKPWAWAVFVTWQWVDEHEKPKEEVINESQTE